MQWIMQKSEPGPEVSPRNSQIKQFTMAENWLIDILIFYHRSYALRGNASRDALRPQRSKIPTRATRHSLQFLNPIARGSRRRASKSAFPRRAWERAFCGDTSEPDPFFM